VLGDGLRVLVVGAGIAGLAAARTLHGWGATVELIERTSGPELAGAGIYLPGNAVRALSALGVGPPVAACAVRIERQRTADQRGRLLFEVRTDDLWPDLGGCLALARADLRHALSGGLDDVPIRWGCGPTEIIGCADGVRVRCSDGNTGDYDLVIGADGVHSTVRRLALPQATGPASIGQTAWRFVVPRSSAPPVWSALLGRESALLTIPISADTVYCYCDGPSPLRLLLAQYAEAGPSLLAALDDPAVASTVHVGPVEEVTLSFWTSGRVVLIGDAAHACSPNMAQGVALAVEDALVLAECLSRGAGITQGLAAYERRRRPRVDWVSKQTRRRDRVRSLPAPVRRAVLRRFGARLTHSQFRPLREPF